MNEEQSFPRKPSFANDRSTEPDVLRMLDKLEELIEGSLHLFNRALLVDLEEFFVLTNRIRASLPDEVKRASRVAGDSDRIVAGARDEADQVVTDAREESARIIAEAKAEVPRLIDSSEISRLATAQAREIVAGAEHTAKEVRAGADEYAKEVLSNLENFASRMIGTIQRGREKLEQRETSPLDDFLGPDMGGRRDRGIRR